MMVPAPWRSAPGSYLLLLTLSEPAVAEIGRLGRVTFPAGRYAYAGSALGPGGVAGRVRRHLRAAKRTHWHIDYLTALAPVTHVAVTYAADRRECAWLSALAALPGAQVPVPGFGSSDCQGSADGARCPAHLVRLPDDLSLSWIENELTRCPIQAI